MEEGEYKLRSTARDPSDEDHEFSRPLGTSSPIGVHGVKFIGWDMNAVDDDGNITIKVDDLRAILSEINYRRMRWPPT